MCYYVSTVYQLHFTAVILEEDVGTGSGNWTNDEWLDSQSRWPKRWQVKSLLPKTNHSEHVFFLYLFYCNTPQYMLMLFHFKTRKSSKKQNFHSYNSWHIRQPDSFNDSTSQHFQFGASASRKRHGFSNSNESNQSRMFTEAAGLRGWPTSSLQGTYLGIYRFLQRVAVKMIFLFAERWDILKTQVFIWGAETFKYI